MRRRLILLALLTIPVPLLAQDSSDLEWLEQCRSGRMNRSQETACDVAVRTIPARSLLRVRPPANGGVKVIADDRRDIEVHVRMQASAASRGDAERIIQRISPEYGSTVTANGPESENWSVMFYIYVPRNTGLDLATQNGPVGVKGVVANMQLQATNGPISLDDVGGDVRARTQNGPLSVRLTGSRWNGSGLDAETQNGPLTLRIPDGYNARLEAGTKNGPFSTGFPLNVTLEGRSNGKHFSTTLGSGGPLVRAMTTNGPLTLRR